MTSPDLVFWPASDPSYERSEVTAVIGYGTPAWKRASFDVLRWKVKTASGFRVDSSGAVSPGQHLTITARMIGLTIREPVAVVAVVDTADRVGFSYCTLPGHPVTGEEAFVVTLMDGEVRLTIRSLTRPAPQQPWRILYPLLRVAQKVARRRYLRALR